MTEYRDPADEELEQTIEEEIKRKAYGWRMNR